MRSGHESEDRLKYIYRLHIIIKRFQIQCSYIITHKKVTMDVI